MKCSTSIEQFFLQLISRLRILRFVVLLIGRRHLTLGGFKDVYLSKSYCTTVYNKKAHSDLSPGLCC